MTEQEFVLRLLSTESGCNSYTFEDAKKLYKEIVKETSNIELSQKVKIEAMIAEINDNQNLFDEQLSGEGLSIVRDILKMLEDLKNA